MAIRDAGPKTVRDKGIRRGTYRCSVPLVRPSKLTSRENGGIGKNLSEGWSLNFAVGCTHGCPFCYVDSIHKRFGNSRYGSLVLQKWGNYFLVPSNIDEAIERTPWERWRNKEVMMSSTHDPYLPDLAAVTRKILEHALPAGVRVCLQTRSCLVSKDFSLLAEHSDQVRLQMSISTLNKEFSRLIEPRVPSPERRLQTLRKAKDDDLRIGVVLAPVFPPIPQRPDVREDIQEIARTLAEIQPDFIYGESLHVRGENIRLIQDVIGDFKEGMNGFDETAGFIFRGELKRAGLKGTWWPETH